MSRLRNYFLDEGSTVHEDELPEDMTEADYDEWFRLSHVDFVRIGPRPFRLPDPTSGQEKP